MKILIHFVLLLFIPLFSAFAQNVEISQVLDSGLYLSSKGQRIRMADLFIPSQNDTNIQLRKLAKEISEWENFVVKDNVFEMKFIDSLSDQSISAILLKNYAFGAADLALNYLSNGYAVYLPSPGRKVKEDLVDSQDRAVKNKVGIWKILRPSYFTTLSNDERQGLKYENNRSTIDKKGAPNVNDPCNNKLLAQLSAKDSLSYDEMKIYVELLKLCESSGKKIGNSNNQYNPGSITYKVKEYKNLPLLPLGILSFVGTYHFFKKASDKSDAIALVHSLLPSADTSELESDKNAASWAGVACIVAGAVFTYISLSPVEVEVQGTQLSFKYNF